MSLTGSRHDINKDIYIYLSSCNVLKDIGLSDFSLTQSVVEEKSPVSKYLYHCLIFIAISLYLLNIVHIHH